MFKQVYRTTFKLNLKYSFSLIFFHLFVQQTRRIEFKQMSSKTPEVYMCSSTIKVHNNFKHVPFIFINMRCASVFLVLPAYSLFIL